MGELGRKTVLKNYYWEKPIKIYRKLYQKFDKRVMKSNRKNNKINKN